MEQIVARYPEGRGRSALLPMLHLVQAEEGYVSPDGVALCADVLGLTKAEVTAVATFYTMFKRRPTGEHIVSVCTNTLCALMGGDDVYAAVSRRLGVGHDETTSGDGTPLTLEHAECLAACDYAPVLTVDYEYFDQVSPESAVEIVEALQRGDKPTPTRGAPLSSFRDTERLLAGFPDPRPDVISAPTAGEPSLAGLAHAEEK
ncbi:MAG TPA: NADH-quinone oxidoreductase subunit NuoE [Mycobacteriales bacterium]